MWLIRLILCLWIVSLSNVAVATYTKVSNSGQALANTAVVGSGPNDWGCTYDSNTNLMWEVKTTDRGLRDQNWFYTWYTTNSPDGNNGTVSGGSCQSTGRCDTEKYRQDVNTQGLCGAKDWRLPSKTELGGLVYCSAGQVDLVNGCSGSFQQPTIDPSFFPNTPVYFFWSSTVEGANSSAAGVGFGSGHYATQSKSSTFPLRLVRSGSPSPASTTPAAVPVANFFMNPSSGSAPLTVHLDGFESSSSNGQITNFSWKTSDNQSASGPAASFTFTQAGIYDITLTVTDALGNKGTTSKRITVTPVPKLASASFASTNNTPESALPILVNDVPVQQLFFTTNDVVWYEYYAKQGINYTVEIPGNSIGNAINPSVQLFTTTGQALSSEIKQAVQFQGIKVSWTAPTTGLYRLRVANNALGVFARAAGDFSYQLRIYKTDAPLQSIIKGYVVNTCNNQGINLAEVSAWLGMGVSDSTYSFKTGEYGLLLNPDYYQVKSTATQFYNGENWVTLQQEINSIIGFQQSPLSGCQSYTPPAVDPAILKQQAVAVYDEASGVLIVRDVWAGPYVYYAELQNIGNLRFQLKRAIILPGPIHAQPADYDSTPLIANLPSVFAFGKNWKIQLRNDQGLGTFSIAAYE